MTSEWPTSGYDAYDEHGNLLGSTGPPPISTPPRRKVKKRWIVLPAVAVLLVALAVAGFFVVKSILAGGASSPEAAGEKLVGAIAGKDAIGIFSIVNPPEREAAMRLQAGLLRNYQRLGLDQPNPPGSVGGNASAAAPTNGDLSFAGVDVALRGVIPEVVPLSADYALLRFRTGTVSLTLRPAETTGSLRQLLDQLNVHDPVEREIAVSELSDSTDGVDLVATKTNGRWYVSPALSLLDLAVVQSTENSEEPKERGNLPIAVSAGSSSPQDAAVVAVSAAVAAVNGRDPTALAPALAKDEAAGLYLYGEATSSETESETSLQLSQVAFSAGPRDGSRQVVYVDRIQGTSGSATFELTGECARSGSDETCINKSPYQYIPGFPIPNPWSLISHDGKLALSAVQGSNGWKISLTDSLVDGVINWADRLTKEQARAMLRRAQHDATASQIKVEQQTEVTFNSGGYAVAGVRVDSAGQYRVTTRDGVDLATEFYPRDGGERIESEYGDDGTYVPLPTGDFKVLVWADSSFKGEGDRASLTVSRIIEPAEFTDEYGTTHEDSVSGSISSGSTSTYTLRIPAGSRSRLQISLDSVYSYGTSAAVIVSVDGRRTRVPLVNGTERVLPVTAGSGEASIEVSLEDSNYSSATYTLRFG